MKYRVVFGCSLVWLAACGGQITTDSSRGAIDAYDDDSAGGKLPQSSAPAGTTPPRQPGVPPAKPGASSCPAVLDIQDCGVSSGYEVNQYEARNADGVEVLALTVYETRSDHRADHHPEGAATVVDRRTEPHVLVVSSYEPTLWHIEKAAGSGLTAVHRIGYHPQRIEAPAGVAVDADQGLACAYSYPYNGGGCDTSEWLATAHDQAGAAVDQLAGCYVATRFEVRDDPSCVAPADGWQQREFAHDTATSGCAGGKSYVKFSSEYQLWIGAELCSATDYKLYLAQDPNGRFDAIADGGGHGQDHCELVNDGFTLPNDDEITSGTCSECSVESLSFVYPGPISVWTRYAIDTPFSHEEVWPAQHYTSSSYHCGVSIP